MKLIFPVLLLLLFSSPAFGKMYEYIDKNGNTVITDTLPSGIDAREKNINEDTVNWSNRSEKDHPSYEAGDQAGKAGPEEKEKKRYDRLNVAMYMTDW